MPLPSRDKNQIRTFIEGLPESLATAGVGLLHFAPRLSPESLSGGGFACAIICLGLAFVLLFSLLGPTNRP